MYFLSSDEILVKRTCATCYGKKVVNDANGIETMCTTCNGDGKVFVEGGTVDELAETLARIIAEKTRAYTGNRSHRR